MLQKRLAGEKVEIRRATALPNTHGDRPLLREVFANLITNGLKYNHKPQRWIEIGSRGDLVDDGRRRARHGHLRA